jgi:Ca2+-binding RTX toxin-like protein
VFFLGASAFAAHDTVLDFQGAGVPGGDEIALQNELAPFVFRGEISIDPVLGAPLPGAGNGVDEVVFTVQGGNTWLLIDENDNGVLNNSDTAIKFNGSLAFTEDDFTRGTDFITAGTPDGDSISGGPDDDVIFGLAGNDSLFGLGGNDTLDGGTGRDLLDGGPGFDELRGGAGADVLTLQDSNFGGNATGGDGRDLLIGSDAPFALVSLAGDAGNDTLQAGASGDTNLVGGDGDDRLEGGAGDDQFTGGAGLDKFIFGPVWTSASGFTDIIWDLEDGVEKIDLRNSGLTESDVTISDDGFSAIITSAAGRIEVSGFAGQITAGDDLLFA